VNPTNCSDDGEATIVPEPDEDVRAAILRALDGALPPAPQSGWAAAALAEGVGEDDA
jgi:hypothetical protein